MSRQSFKNICMLIDSAKEDATPEQSFLGDLKRSIELTNDKAVRAPSKTYKPSSMTCIRNMYYQVTGHPQDPQASNYTLVGICNAGTDIHERVQKYVADMINNDIDCEYIDVAEFVKQRELDYLEVVERLNDTDIDMMEINISCPNVKEGAIAFGQKAESVFDITKQVRSIAKKPVIMKLSPNVTDITEMARAAEAAGADAISLINTITGMKIDINKRSFVLANKTGGMSGPAIKPIAVRMVYQCAQAVKIPIIGMGGIANAEDAIEFLMAGATAVAAGAMNFVNPYLTQELVDGIEAFLDKNNVGDINDIIGCVK